MENSGSRPVEGDRPGDGEGRRGFGDRQRGDRGVGERGMGERDGRGAHAGADHHRGEEHREAVPVAAGGVPVEGVVPQSRSEATLRQKEAYGGVKVGSAFFGWLTATGTAVLLTALVAAAGAAVGVNSGASLTDAATQTTQNPDTAKTVGLVGGIALLVVLLVSYFCGGYVAGRMARFNGLRQGLAVWLWAVLIAIVVAVAATVAGSKYDVLGRLNSFPRLPIGGNVTTGGIIALAAVAVASLVGALLGGVAGMRFHRKVDQAAFEPVRD